VTWHFTEVNSAKPTQFIDLVRMYIWSRLFSDREIWPVRFNLVRVRADAPAV
jgi:hypothetical protein